MNKISNEEYIKNLKSILEKEKAKENEEIQMLDDIEIKEQLQEIKSLEKEIQNIQKNFEKNDSNIINFEVKNLDINYLQKKAEEDIIPKLIIFYNQLEKNIKEKIIQMKEKIKESSGIIINQKYELDLNAITETKLNDDKLENKDIKEPRDNYGKKAQKKSEEILNKNHNSKMDMNKYINKGVQKDNTSDFINQINYTNIESKQYIHINSFNRASNNFKKNSNNNNNDLNSFNNVLNQNKNPTTIKIISKNNQNMNDSIKKDNKTQMIPKVKEMENQEKNEKKKSRKMYTSVNKIFYQDYQQKFINAKRISDIEKEELEREIMKEMKNNNKDLIRYCLNFIEENVLKHFKSKKLKDEEREILKYNIETVLEICGKDKNTYRNYYYPEARAKPKVVNRGKSVEALKKFRKEFSISDKEYSDEGLINRLNENNLDIYKTFEKIFGI